MACRHRVLLPTAAAPWPAKVAQRALREPMVFDRRHRPGPARPGVASSVRCRRLRAAIGA